MIRIGQTGDLHVSVGPRFKDTVRCIDYLVEDGAKQGVQLWLLGGDLTGTTVPHESYLAERNYIDTVIQRMAETAPVVILRGNHDEVLDVMGYGRLAGEHPIYLVTKPRSITIDTAAGPVQLFCLPYPDKATLIEVGRGAIKDDNRAAADVLRAHLGTWKLERSPAVPSILVAHLTVAGCELAGGEVLADKEVELWREDLEAFGADWCALSHIHKWQMMTPRAAYAGSPNAQDFGAIDDKGYLIVDVDAGTMPVVHRRATPSRKMVTVAAEWKENADGAFSWAVGDAAIPAGAEVRVKVLIPEGQRGTCPTEQLDAMMRERGAHAVQVDRNLIPTNRVRSAEIGSAQTTADRVNAYWNSLGENGPVSDQRARCLDLLPELEREAQRSDTVAEDRADALNIKFLRCKGAGNSLPDEVEIDFDALGDGIIAFIGENGSGKSHLLELAGPATWYGQYLYYEDKFIGHVPHGIRDAFSELVWESDGHTFRALIKADPQFGGSKGKTEGYLYRDGVALNPSGKMTDYAAAIAKYVPDQREARASIISAQGGRGSLFSLPKAERKDMFIKMLNLEHLQAESVAAAKRADALGTKLEILRAEMAQLEAQSVRADELVAAIAAATSALAEATAAAQEAATATASAQAECERASDVLARAEAAAEIRAADRRRLEEAKENAGAQVITLQEQRTATLATVADRAAIEAAVEELSRLDREIAGRRSDEDALRATLAPTEAAITEKTPRLVELRAAAGVLVRSIAEATAAQAEVDAAGDIDAQVADTEKAVNDVDVEISSVDAAIKALEQEEATEARLTEQRTALQASIDALAPRTGLVDKIDIELPLCAACPLTADAREAVAKLAVAHEQLAALALPVAPEETARAKLVAKRTELRTAQAKRTTLERELSDRRATQAALVSKRATAATLAERTSDLEANKTVGVPLAAEVSALEQQRAKIATSISASCKAREVKEQRRAEILPTANRGLELAGADARIAELDASIGRLSVDIEALVARIAEIADDAALLDAHRLTANTRQQELAAAQAAQRLRDAAVRTREDEVSTLRGELAGVRDAAARLDAARREEAAIVTEIGDWRLLARALGRDGAQALCLDQAGPVISEICNDLLRVCFASQFSIDIITAVPKVDGSGLKEVFEIVILHAERGRIDKGCGGEMAIINEALRSAIAIYNIRSSGYQCRTLWRDEASDGLSEINQDRYIQMLRRVREIGGFKRILLIDHSRRVWAQADHQIFVSGATATRPAQVFLDDEAAWCAHEDGEDAAAAQEAA